MKKIIVFIACFMIAVPSFAALANEFQLGFTSHTETNDGSAANPVWVSSNTPYAGNGPQAGDILTGILVGSTVAASGASVILYDSTGTTVNKLANIQLTNVGAYPFYIRLSTGIAYVATGNIGAGFNIIWQKTRPY